MNPARQSALWTKYEMFNTPRTVIRTARPKRSEKRKRTERVHVRLLPSEQEALSNAADVLGITVAEFVRWSALKFLDGNWQSLIVHREYDNGTKQEVR